MKPINFIKAASPKEQQALHRWFWRSCVLLVTLVMSLCTLYINQFYTLQALRTAYNTLESTSGQLDHCLTEKRRLKDQEGKLKQRLTKTTRIKRKPKNPAPLLKLFISTLPQGVSLHTFNLKKKHLDIILFGTTSQDILAYLKQLKKHTLFAQIDMHTLEPSDGHVKTTLEATLS